MRACRYTIFDTAGGACGLAWSPSGIIRFQLPASDAATTARLLVRRLPADAVEDVLPASIAAVIDQIRQYFSGARVDFGSVVLDLDGQSDFFRRIYASARRLGWGQTTTYGAIAKELGTGPEAARDVGQAMAKNPVALIIPCHRVLAAGGRIGGFSAPGGAGSKTRMLELEGIVLAANEPAQQSLPF